MPRVDLNCDLGESFGAWTLGTDEALMPTITSANIACGFHAGDPAIMRRTVRLAQAHAVAIGAHPGLPDLAGFGRREMAVTPEEVFGLVVYQLGALQACARAEGATVTHVKPHGALYNMAAKNAALAGAIARAVAAVDPALALFGLAGSALITAAEGAGLRAAREAFADRRYFTDGSLMPRSNPDAVIRDADEAVAQTVRLVEAGAETICLHGDTPDAAEFARRIRAGLAARGVDVRPFSQP